MLGLEAFFIDIVRVEASRPGAGLHVRTYFFLKLESITCGFHIFYGVFQTCNK